MHFKDEAYTRSVDQRSQMSQLVFCISIKKIWVKVQLKRDIITV